jgi:hypothetical protein
MNFRLEYSEAQGNFHFDNGTHEPGTNGWVTICESLPDRECTAFTKVAYKVYAGLYTKDKAPTLKQIQHLFEVWDCCRKYY